MSSHSKRDLAINLLRVLYSVFPADEEAGHSMLQYMLNTDKNFGYV